jgi:hypothetical protein
LFLKQNKKKKNKVIQMPSSIHNAFSGETIEMTYHSIQIIDQVLVLFLFIGCDPIVLPRGPEIMMLKFISKRVILFSLHIELPKTIENIDIECH